MKLTNTTKPASGFNSARAALEVSKTWKISKVAEAVQPRKPMTVITQSSSSESFSQSSSFTPFHAPMSSSGPSDPLNIAAPAMFHQEQQASLETLPQAAMIDTRPQPANWFATKAVWYLGGNQVVKLLTSVDGDLDPLVLAKIAAVPSVVGDLALSVESLVSDDFTVGGFESDLLAQITSNTLEAKRASLQQQPDASSATGTSVDVDVHFHVPPPQPAEEQAWNPDVSQKPRFVPDPLAAASATYKPVPNPLARITPPGSPTPTSEDRTNSKRKESPMAPLSMPNAKRSNVPAPSIQAR